MLGPVFEELASEYTSNEQVKFVKVNTDESPEIARQFMIRGIPTIKFIKNGKEVDQQVGAVPKEVIAGFISKHI
jgi:thioredoxin 1